MLDVFQNDENTVCGIGMFNSSHYFKNLQPYFERFLRNRVEYDFVNDFCEMEHVHIYSY